MQTFPVLSGLTKVLGDTRVQFFASGPPDVTVVGEDTPPFEFKSQSTKQVQGRRTSTVSVLGCGRGQVRNSRTLHPSRGPNRGKVSTILAPSSTRPRTGLGTHKVSTHTPSRHGTSTQRWSRKVSVGPPEQLERTTVGGRETTP